MNDDECYISAYVTNIER